MRPIPAKPIYDPNDPQLIDAILPNLTALATPPALEGAAPAAAVPRAPAGYMPSAGLPGSIAAAMKAPAGMPAAAAVPRAPAGYAPSAGLPGRIAAAMKAPPSPAPAAASATVVAPMSLAQYLKANPVPAEAPAQYKPPGFWRRLAFGASAGAAGWGHPEIGAQMVARYNQGIADREQQAEQENRELPLRQAAEERQAYDQYLGEEGRKAQIANAASEIAGREAPPRAPKDDWHVIPGTNWEVNAASGQARQIAGMEEPPLRDGVNHPIAGTAGGKPAFAVYSPGKGWLDPNSGALLHDFAPAQRGGMMSGYAAARMLDYAYRFDPRLLPMAVEAVQESVGPGAPGMPTDAPPAQPLDAAGHPVGLSQPIAPTSSTRSRGQFAQAAVLDQVEGLRKEIASLSGDLGPMAGRWHDYMVGKVGAPNQAYARLKTGLDNLATAWMRLHANSETARQDFLKMVSGAQSPENLLGTIDAIEQQARAYAAEGEGRPSAPAAQGGAHPLDGTVAETPHGKVVLKGGRWVPYEQ